MGYSAQNHMLRNRKTCPKCHRVQVVTFQSRQPAQKCKYCGAVMTYHGDPKHHPRKF